MCVGGKMKGIEMLVVHDIYFRCIASRLIWAELYRYEW